MQPSRLIICATSAFISLFVTFPAHILAAPVNTYGDLKINGLLDTTGGIKFSDGSTLNTSGLNGLLFNVGLVVDNSGSNAGNIYNGTIKFGSDLGGVGIGSQQVPSNSLNKYGLDFYTGGTSRLSILNNGYVGIGTRSPTNPLDVRLALGGLTYARFGMDNVAPLYMIAGSPHVGFNVYFNSGYKYGSAAPAGYLAFNQDVAGGFSFTTAPSGLTDAAATMTPRLVITSDGKVGIGTTTPAQALDVAGTVNATLFNGSGTGLTGIQKKYGGVAVVAKSGGDFSDPAVAMTAINYASWCGVPSATNPCLLKVMPGVYTVTTPVAMQPFIDIEGSGEKVTKITSALNSPYPFTATVLGSNNAELRFLTVENTGTGNDNIAMYNTIASPSISFITVSATGTTNGNNYGVYNVSSSPTMTNMTVTASTFTAPASGSRSFGVFNTLSSPTMTNMIITVTGGVASSNYGVWNYTSPSPAMTNVTASANGGSASNNYGVYFAGCTAPTMINVTATASSGVASNSYGVYSDSSSPTMINVTATGSGAKSTYGVYNITSGTVKINNSTIKGSTNTIKSGSGVTTLIGNTQLDGGVVSGAFTCVGVYNGATYSAMSATCL